MPRLLLAAALGLAMLGCATPKAQPLVLPERPAAPPTLPGFSRGLNLGNALDAPSIGAWGVVLQEEHFRYAAEAGFDHIRLPARFSGRAALHPPYTIDPEFFEKVDWAVAQAHRYGLNIIIDLHHYEEIMQDPDAHADRFVALWDQIARHYADEPPSVAFELLNEPNGALDPARLNALMQRTIPVVRQSNPRRLLIVDSYFWAAAKHLQDLELPDDPNLAASFHMYQPILFTHQGADWMEPWYQTRGIIFPGPPEEPLTPVAAASEQGWVTQWFEAYNREPAATNPSGMTTVRAEFDLAEAYAKRTGIPVYMGEFAVIDHAEPQSRENWLRAVRREAEARGMGWAYWDDGGKNKALDVATGTWEPFIVEALLGAEPPG